MFKKRKVRQLLRRELEIQLLASIISRHYDSGVMTIDVEAAAESIIESGWRKRGIQW